MTLLDRYIFRLLLMRMLPLWLALFLVMMIERALRLVQEMSSTGLDARYFPALMADLAPYYVNLSLPAAFAAALIIVTLSLAGHREIETIAGLGLRLSRIMRPMMALGCLVALAGVITGGWLEPLGRYQYRIEHAVARDTSELATLQPRAIYAPGAGLMFTADDQGGGGRFFSPVLWTRDAEGEELLVTGRAATLVQPAGASSLLFDFENGEMLVGTPGTDDLRVVNASDLRIREELRELTALWERGKDASERTLGELFADSAEPMNETAADRSSAIWSRLTRALSAPFLPFLVVPLLLAGGRRRAVPIVIAVSLMALFHHGVNLAKNLGHEGAQDPAVAMMWVIASGSAAVLAVWLLGGGQPGPTWLGRVMASGSRPAPSQPGTVDRKEAWPGKATLGGYLVRQVLLRSLAVLAVLVLVMQLVDFIEHGEDLVSRGEGLSGSALFMLYRAPTIAEQMIPVAALAGPLLAFLTMRGTRELIAIQLNGISAFGIWLRSIPSALVLGAILLVLAEWASPAGQFGYARWWNEQGQQAEDVPAAPKWFRIGEEVVRVDGISASGNTLEKPRIYSRDATGRIARIVVAASASHAGDDWRLEGGREIAFDPLNRRSETQRAEWWESTLTPNAARRFAVGNIALSASEARNAIRADAPQAHAEPYYRTRFYRPFVAPFIPLVMLLLAMPVVFAAQQPRELNASLFVAVFAGLGFLLLDGFFVIMGRLGQVEAWFAVSAAPLLFLTTGFAWLLRSERVRPPRVRPPRPHT